MDKVRNVIWNSENRFNEGTPDFTDTAIVGSGDSASIRLDESGTFTEDVPFTTSGNYTYDIGEIEVTGGKAKLKSLSTTNTDWPFTTPANYTYNSSKIDVSGGEAFLKQGTGLHTDLKFYLELENNANDSTTNGNNGTPYNMTYTSGKFGQCGVWNGSSSNINIPDHTSHRIQNEDFSLGCWFYISSLPGASTGLIHHQCFGIAGFGLYIDSLDQLGLQIQWGAGSLYFRYKHQLTTGHTGQWNFAAGTIDRSGYLRLYLNGSEVGNVDISSASGNSLYYDNNGIHVGCYRNSSWWLNGNIDDVFLYKNRVLTADEITDMWNSGTGHDQHQYYTDTPSIETNTGWGFTNDLSTFTETSTKPDDSEIKYHLSSDNGSTWKYWTGSAWSTTDGTYAQSNTATEVNSNIGDLASSGTLKVRALLSANSNGTLTCALDNIFVEQQTTYNTGSYEIEMNTDIQPAKNTEYVSTAETVTKPANTNIKYQYSIDGGSVYNGSWLTEAQLESALQSIVTVGDGSDKIRFKFQLSTTDANSTPEIDNLAVEIALGFPSTGSYTSTQYAPEDAGSGVVIGQLVLDLTTPNNTTATVEVRGVESILEDHWIEVASDVFYVNTSGDFIQFRITMTTSDGKNTPVLNSAKIYFVPQLIYGQKDF